MYRLEMMDGVFDQFELQYTKNTREIFKDRKPFHRRPDFPTLTGILVKNLLTCLYSLCILTQACLCSLLHTVLDEDVFIKKFL